MFRHPKYYKELRKRALDERNSELHVRPILGSEACDTDQAISLKSSDENNLERATGPGLKLQAREDSTAKRVAEPQASSVKPQAPEDTSDKHQAPSSKRQA